MKPPALPKQRCMEGNQMNQQHFPFIPFVRMSVCNRIKICVPPPPPWLVDAPRIGSFADVCCRSDNGYCVEVADCSWEMLGSCFTCGSGMAIAQPSGELFLRDCIVGGAGEDRAANNGAAYTHSSPTLSSSPCDAGGAGAKRRRRCRRRRGRRCAVGGAHGVPRLQERRLPPRRRVGPYRRLLLRARRRPLRVPGRHLLTRYPDASFSRPRTHARTHARTRARARAYAPGAGGYPASISALARDHCDCAQCARAAHLLI